MTTRSTHRDPRNIIIPDAFEVSEEEAEEAVSGLSEVADDLGIERDEMPGLVLAAVPDDGAENVADWGSASL